jgi:hypothetical protein
MIFSLDEVIAAVLRNEIYSKTGRRRLGSLFPRLVATWIFETLFFAPPDL